MCVALVLSFSEPALTCTSRPQLLVIEALQATGNQDHIDVAEILQNKLYYEADTLDMVVSLVTRYNGQSYK